MMNLGKLRQALDSPFLRPDSEVCIMVTDSSADDELDLAYYLVPKDAVYGINNGIQLEIDSEVSAGLDKKHVLTVGELKGKIKDVWLNTLKFEITFTCLMGNNGYRCDRYRNVRLVNERYRNERYSEGIVSKTGDLDRLILTIDEEMSEPIWWAEFGDYFRTPAGHKDWGKDFITGDGDSWKKIEGEVMRREAL